MVTNVTCFFFGKIKDMFFIIVVSDIVMSLNIWNKNRLFIETLKIMLSHRKSCHEWDWVSA